MASPFLSFWNRSIGVKKIAFGLFIFIAELLIRNEINSISLILTNENGICRVYGFSNSLSGKKS